MAQTKQGARATKTLDDTRVKETATQRRKRLDAELAREKIGGGLAGFVEFIREKGVVGLAIGLAIGTAASGLVTQIVNAVITPIVGLLIGKDGLKGVNWQVTIGDRSEVFAFGDLLDAMIKFLAIAAVIYFVVLGLKLDKLDKPKESK